jgi:hypothetical protein
LFLCFCSCWGGGLLTQGGAQSSVLDYIIKIEQEHSYGLAIKNFLNETFHAQLNRMRFQKILEFYIICYMLVVVLRM